MKQRGFLTIAVGLILVALIIPALSILAAPSPPGIVEQQMHQSPNLGRPAPYGQYIVAYNEVVITTTGQYGTAARTAGYDIAKVLICQNEGTDTAEVDLYGSTTSGGALHLLEDDLASVAAAGTAWVPFTHIGPWMTLGITSSGTSSMTCAIWAQTP
jgi:hypothetical protein